MDPEQQVVVLSSLTWFRSPISTNICLVSFLLVSENDALTGRRQQGAAEPNASCGKSNQFVLKAQFCSSVILCSDPRSALCRYVAQMYYLITKIKWEYDTAPNILRGGTTLPSTTQCILGR